MSQNPRTQDNQDQQTSQEKQPSTTNQPDQQEAQPSGNGPQNSYDISRPTVTQPVPSYGNNMRYNPARRTQSDQPTIQKPTVQKPTIQKPNEKPISIQKAGKDLKIDKKIQLDKPHSENPNPNVISIVKPNKGEKTSLFTFKHFNFESLLDEWKKLDNETFSPFPIRSKGYIILKNYVLDTDKESQFSSSRSPRGRQNQGRGKRPQFVHSTSVATLVELNKNRFTSTQLEKNIGEWDETSEEAFKININQILNRLTPKNMDQSINEIKEQISIKKDQAKDREQFVAKTLVDKATKEQSFSDLYAQFTSKCSENFIEKVVKLNHSSINDSIVNPGSENDELQALICNGSAKFFASLANFNLETEESIYDIISFILTELKNKGTPHSHHVEMLNSFYLNISPEVANKIDEIFDNDEVWTVIDQIMNIPTLKKRLYFLLLDIKEKRDGFRQNQNDSQDTNKTVNDQSSKENMNKVRGAFSSYLESYSLPDIDMTSRDFLFSALDIFPDETKAYFDFCQFIASELKSMHAQKNDTTKILLDKVQKFKEQSIEKECPNIWANISTLINMLLLEDLINLDRANEIHKKFPEPVWDFSNSMKWYIYDFHDFSKAIHVTKWPLELSDALSLPERLDNLNSKDFLMSRLICVALIRSLYQKFKDLDKINFHNFSKWKPQLALAAKRHPDTFKIEMEILFNDFEITKTVDQFIDYCNKET